MKSLIGIEIDLAKDDIGENDQGQEPESSWRHITMHGSSRWLEKKGAEAKRASLS